MPLPSARATSGRRLGPSTISAMAPRNSRWTGLSIPITHQASACLAADPTSTLCRWQQNITPARASLSAAAESEPFWPAQLTILAAIGLQVALPARLSGGARWLMPALEGVLLIGMFLATPHELEHEHKRRRRAAISLTAFVGAANIYSLGALTHFLLHHKVA